MSADRKRSGVRISEIAVMSAVFALMLYLTAATPMMSDDWHFKFVWRDFYPLENDTRVRSLSDITESMKYYYMYSGGRVICHFITYCLINFNRWLYLLLNPLMFVLFGRLVFSLIKQGCKVKINDGILLALVYLVSFLAMPTFGDDFLWISGSVNYLWPSVLMLYCIRLIEKSFKELTLKKALLISVPICLSAATNEVTGGMLIVFMILTICGVGGKPLLIRLIPMAAAIPGTLLVILAPGNSVRAAHIEKVEIFSISDTLDLAMNYLLAAVQNYPAGFAVMLIAIVLYIGSKSFKTVYRFRYLLTGAAGMMALGASGVYQPRATLFGAVMIVIASFQAVFFIPEYFESGQLDAKRARITAWKVFAAAVFIFWRVRNRYEGIITMLVGVSALIALLTLTYKLEKLLSSEQGRALLTQRLEELKGKSASIQRLTRRLLTCASLIAAAGCIAATAYQTALFRRNVAAAEQITKDITENIIDGKFYEAAHSKLFIDSEVSVLFSAECYMNFNNDYTIAWMAQYMGIDFDYSIYDDKRAWS